MAVYSLNVNGKAHNVRVDDPQMPLLYALRHDLDSCPICSWAASPKRKVEERR